MIREWNEESLDHRNTLLYAMGISEEDAKRPIIGLVNTWNEMNPGHYPFDKALIAEMKEEIYKLGGLALELPISGICDGICSNTPGDRYTLPARDLVSSEVEMVANLNMLEGMVIMATCDKVVPGMLMGAVRVDIPTVMFTGDMRGVIWWAVCLAVDLLIWYPFFKTYEKQEVEKEAAEALAKA